MEIDKFFGEQKMQHDSIEHEVTFVVNSPRPERVTESLSKIDLLGGFRLSTPLSRIFRDLYFDAADGSLASKNWALRIRIPEGAHPSAALKGPSVCTDCDSQKRVEIEGLWSENFFSEISRKLLDLITFQTAIWQPDPIETFLRSGLEIIQDRSAKRITRLFFDMSGRPIAEMALDAVSYQFDRGPLVHHEVEVEFRTVSSDQIRAIINDVKCEYGEEVRLWHLSKLATGIVLGKLVKNNLLPFSVKYDAPLTPETYDIIDYVFAMNERSKC